MRVSGTVAPPGDKSISYRALFVAALARGPVRLEGLRATDDLRRAAGALRLVGVKVSSVRESRTVTVAGGDWTTPDAELHCGGSSTAADLMIGALASRPIRAVVTGDRSLRSRSLGLHTIPLRAMGAVIDDGGRDALPVSIEGGRLRSLCYHSPAASGRVKAALLLAAAGRGVEVSVSEPMRSRDHMERLLTALGFAVEVRGRRVSLRRAPRGWPMRSWRLEIPGDFSLGAYFLAAGLLARRGQIAVEGVGVNPMRTGLLSVLQRMGANVTRSRPRTAGEEPVADLVARPSRLEPVEVPAEETVGLTDEMPLLAILASRADGESVFRKVGNLRVRDDDRLERLARSLRALGIESEVQDGDLHVHGSDRPPRGQVDTGGDSRLAMAFAVLARVPGAAVDLPRAGSVRAAYPNFHLHLDRVVSHD